MKIALLAAAALFATPALAQTTPANAPTPTQDQATMSPPPTDTPPPSQAMSAMPSTPAGEMAAPTASTGKMPWCRKGQFTACREHENKKGEGVSKS